ncbi:MAG: PHP domain-containing protein, partial [Xanthobacteraceae bacterium]|nr:PHP domain-containing protein [Xanthobacteraceae bacterium]
MAADPQFVHLHVHSSYSLLEGAMTIPRLAELAKADRQPALALTDTDNMFGALEFSDKLAGYGIQPIIGCELAVDFADQDPNARNALAAAPARLVLLAARERGYRSLMKLNSRAFQETPVHQTPHIKLEWLEGEAEDLIALTGGPDGPIALALGADHSQLAAQERGYRNLMRLNSRAFLETPVHQAPHVKLDWLEGQTDGLIALT